VYRVGDDQDVGLGGVVGGGLGQIADDGGVGVEQVWGVVSCATDITLFLRTITGHAGLAGDTGGNNNDLSALERLGET